MLSWNHGPTARATDVGPTPRSAATLQLARPRPLHSFVGRRADHTPCGVPRKGPGARPRHHAIDEVRCRIRDAPRRTRAPDASRLATERDHDFVAACLAAHSREAVEVRVAIAARRIATFGYAASDARTL